MGNKPEPPTDKMRDDVPTIPAQTQQKDAEPSLSNTDVKTEAATEPAAEPKPVEEQAVTTEVVSEDLAKPKPVELSSAKSESVPNAELSNVKSILSSSVKSEPVVAK